MTEPTRFPLAWPHGKPRRPWQKRRAGNFSTTRQKGGNSWRTKRDITVAQAMVRLTAEVDRLGGRYPLLSSNLELRLDGQPRSGQSQPDDPGVCLYFSLNGEPMAMACDAYDKVEQNIAALAAHIDATRAIARYGVATAAETLQAFHALPRPKTCWEILGLAGAGQAVSADAVQKAWRDKMREHHPDTGGNHDSAAEINAARDQALAALAGLR